MRTHSACGPVLGLLLIFTTIATVLAQTPTLDAGTGIRHTPENIQDDTRLKRLLWSPRPAIEPMVVFDRCNDQEAIASGMDGGALDEVRQRLGIDCEHNTGYRYAYRVRGGSTVLSQERPTIDVLEEGDASRASAHLLPLGSYNEPRLTGLSRDPDDSRIQIDQSTVSNNGHAIRGLAVNASDEWLEEVVASTPGGSYEYPLSVQPGEVFPFEIAGGTKSLSSQAITFSYTVSTGPDLTRAIRVTGMPGDYSRAERDSFVGDQLHEVFSNESEPGLQSEGLFATGLEITEPWVDPSSYALPEASKRVSSVSNLTAVAVSRDASGKVLDVMNLPILGNTSDEHAELAVIDNPTLTRGGSLITGLLLDSEMFNFSIWVGAGASDTRVKSR